MRNSTSLGNSAARPLHLLRDGFLHLKHTQKLRNREAAHALGVSEGEALAAFVGKHVVRLEARFVELFEEMPALGPVMALTRNEAAVHEKYGPFEQMSHDGQMGLALGSAIDLRIFYRNWAAGFAVQEETARGAMKSVQFFDAQGHAVHKVFLREHSDHALPAVSESSYRACRADQTRARSGTRRAACPSPLQPRSPAHRRSPPSATPPAPARASARDRSARAGRGATATVRSIA